MAKKFEKWQPFDCEGINLDGFSDSSDLWEFQSDARGVRPITMARTLFPSQPQGYVQATKDLCNYAANKATAMDCRKRGDIQTALHYESIAERIYGGLPEFARW